MHRVTILAFGVLFAVVTSGCAGDSANPLSPSAVVDSGVSSGSATSATQARGSGGGGGGKPSKGGGTFELDVVNDVNGDDKPNRGDSVTFIINTSVAEPYVELICKQNGELVYGKVAGYFDGYPWPWSQVMLLSSDLWVGGAADCVADLYYFNRLTRTSMAKLSFTAYQ